MTTTPVHNRAMVRKIVPSLVLNGVIPLVAYLLLRPVVGSETVALAIGGAIPFVVTVGGFVVRRKLDPVGVIAVLAFAVALVALALSGGDPLMLKLHDAILTGPLGLVCLLSVPLGQPLLYHVARLVTKGKERPLERRPMAMMTALVGTVMVLHALLILFLAVSLPTATFLAVGKPIGWALLAIGVGILYWYRSKLRAQV